MHTKMPRITEQPRGTGERQAVYQFGPVTRALTAMPDLHISEVLALAPRHSVPKKGNLQNLREQCISNGHE